MTSTDDTGQPTDAERFHHLLRAERAACLRDRAPSLTARRSDPTWFKAALIARRAGKLLSGGQTCIAPDDALVHESEIDAFTERTTPVQRPGPGRGEHLRKEATDG
ncbi:hypothetical protein [Streptomyces tibetensis]|uniref:hypothetical protein n=1 Tax=Streptomyces tibetensis TaxID=2382123 RepID=UPI0034103F7C